MQIPQPRIEVEKSASYRESYANSVQVHVNLWDFFLTFGTATQTTPDRVVIDSFQGIYISPQQAKALANLLNDNLARYEATFGEIQLTPKTSGGTLQ